MATSMAAALAASLPAPQAAPTPAAPTYEAIPASMSKVIDIEADIPLTAVQLDGLAVSKITKHSSDSTSSPVHGLLLGLDLDGILEVSNSFPLPHHASDEDDKTSKGSARYQTSMLRSLKEVRADDSVVGFYQSTTMGAFFSQTLIDTQAIHQDKLRHGGIVVVHDISQTSKGNASFRAFRLTAAFLDAYKKHSFSSQSLIDRKLTFSSILEEVPLKIRTNPLLGAFLDTLKMPQSSVLPGVHPAESVTSPLPPSFSALDLGNAALTRNLEHTIEALDSYKVEEGNLAYLSRQIGREKARADTYVAKRKEENVARVAQGLPPLPEEDVSRLFKLPPEPSRLESLLLLGQVDAYAKTLEGTSSSNLVKMYAAKADAASAPRANAACSVTVGIPGGRTSPSGRLQSNGDGASNDNDPYVGQTALCETRWCRTAPARGRDMSSAEAVVSAPIRLSFSPIPHRLPSNSPIPEHPHIFTTLFTTPSHILTITIMQFFTSALVALTFALSVMAITSPSVAGAIHRKRCGDHSSDPAATPAAEPSPAAPPAAPAAEPAAEPAKVAAPVSNAAAAGFLSGTQTGQGTWYSTGLGACGITNNDNDHIVAVSHMLFDSYPGANANPNSNPVCNKKIKAHYQGKSVTVTVTDRCTGCKMTDLDFAPSAFQALAGLDVGRLNGVTWQWA